MPSSESKIIRDILSSMDQQQQLFVQLQGNIIQQMTHTNTRGQHQVDYAAIQQKMNNCHMALSQLTALKIQFQNSFGAMGQNETTPIDTNNISHTSPNLAVNNNYSANAPSTRDLLKKSAGAKPFMPSVTEPAEKNYYSSSQPLPSVHTERHWGDHRNANIDRRKQRGDKSHHQQQYNRLSNGGNYRRKRDPRSGAEFHVDVDAILSGSDSRSTVMIQNIPNNYTQAMLIEEIDAHFDKTYDFFYLPMDYKNKCNIGYAFVNFMDCSHVASFYAKFHCREWQRFKSHKICAVKYGRIQGKLNLIQHFKSTNVVKEASMDYRPLLFYSAGPQMGAPEPFSDYM